MGFEALWVVGVQVVIMVVGMMVLMQREGQGGDEGRTDGRAAG